MTVTDNLVEGVRRDFQVCSEGAYLDVAARAPMADHVARELKDFIDVSRATGAPKQEWLARVESTRERVARFIGASPSEVAFMKNTSDGLNSLAHGLNLRHGDNVIICPEIEHPNNVYMWLPMQDRGVEIRFVAGENGAVPLDGIADAIDENTRLITLSSVSFISGARADLAALSELCRPREIFLLVDAVQELGIMNVDVAKLGIDGMSAATQKGLLGIYGCGVLYCRSEWLPRIQPHSLSRTGIDLGTEHESEIGDIYDYTLKSTASKLEIGNPNFAGIFALDGALSLLESIDRQIAEDHVVDLAQQLMNELDARGFCLLTPRGREQHAGIVTFAHPDAEAVVHDLKERDIKVSFRRGSIRVSFHVYNNREDVALFLDSIVRN